MTGYVQRAVLPLAVRIVGRRLEDPRTGPLGLLIVSVSVVDADEHRVRDRLPVDASLRMAGGDDDGAIAEDDRRRLEVAL